MSTLKVNAITDASGGNTATINSMTPTADSLQGFRNRIINGNMTIDQRNAGASVTGNNQVYSVDRWKSIAYQASKFTMQQNAGAVTPPTGFKKYLGITSSSSYSVGTGETFSIVQVIEGYNIADLGWGAAGASSVTLSFWVRSSLTGTFGGALWNADATRSYPFAYTINVANTWEQKTITIAGDTSGTWASDNTAGINVNFGLGVGASSSGTAGSWGSTFYTSATGATSVVGTNGATFYITGVQLEAGSVATPFERRDYGRELMMCQRYYEKSYDLTTVPGTNTFIGAVVGFGLQGATLTTQYIVLGPVRFGITKRATPTIVLYDMSGNSGRVTADEVGLGSSNNQIASVSGELNMQGFGVLRTPTQAAANGGRFQYTASAEL